MRRSANQLWMCYAGGSGFGGYGGYGGYVRRVRVWEFDMNEAKVVTWKRLESGDKVTRFGGFSAQAEAGNVKVLRGPWNDRWFSELEGFPDAAHDDDADSTSRAFNALNSASTYSLRNI